MIATFVRKHHSPLYIILYDFSRRLHSNDFFSKTPTYWNFGCSKTLNAHIFFKSSLFEHARTITYSPQKDFSNGVLHAPIRYHLSPTLRGFMVQSQIENLTLGPSFDHNSCTSSLNE